MPFEGNGLSAANRGPERRLRIAVVGGGVAGLSAAWLLSSRHDAIVYERDRRLGGHANTVEVEIGGNSVPVDAGFIVYNRDNYPNLTALFERLGVTSEATDMSFGASLDGGRVEYCGDSLSSLFARRRNVASPSHWAMLADIVRFNREAKAALLSGLGDEVTLGDFLDGRRFSAAFVTRFLEPMAAAIWSTPSLRILDYPAASLFRFYDNHSLLQTSNQPKWSTVTGGSREYVARISASFRDHARLGTGVAQIERIENGVRVIDETGAADIFDAVVIATHADRALAVLKSPTDRERSLLGAFKYQSNRAAVHFDRRQMPQRRAAWASWNYLGGDGAASVTYWMNRLQNLNCGRDVFVTLNPAADAQMEDVVAEFDYEHPMFDVAACRAQKELWSLQGAGGVWFCGAHFGAGFHEDGLQSGLAVAEDLGGVRRPWRVANESARIWRRAPALPLAAE